MQYRPKIEKFLCYYDLTTGGLWIGCLTFFGSIIFILLDIFCMVIVYLNGCKEFQNHLKIYGLKMSETQYKICEIGISSKMQLEVWSEPWNFLDLFSYLGYYDICCFSCCCCLNCCAVSHTRIWNCEFLKWKPQFFIKVLLLNQQRDHHKVRPFMTLVIVGAILSLLPLLSFNLTIIIGGIIAEIICLFAFVNVYSLYLMLKEENDKLISVETVERY